MWMMPDSDVDIYILEQGPDDENGDLHQHQESKIPLINNIGQVFGKCAKDQKKQDFDSGIRS